MYTLNNVDSQQDESPTTSAQFALRTISNETSAGVSVGNGLDKSARWYVLRVSYSRELKACEWLKGRGLEVFLPMHNEVRQVDGKHKKVSKPLIPNILFVRSTLMALDPLIHHPANTCLSYYYNHFSMGPDGKNPPLTVPDRQMSNFILLSKVDTPNILFVSHQECRFKSGDQVVLASGPFKGIVGRVVRAKRQQRVAIEIASLGVVTTAYVPSGCMRKII